MWKMGLCCGSYVHYFAKTSRFTEHIHLLVAYLEWQLLAWNIYGCIIFMVETITSRIKHLGNNMFPFCPQLPVVLVQKWRNRQLTHLNLNTTFGSDFLYKWNRNWFFNSFWGIDLFNCDVAPNWMYFVILE